MAKIGIQDDLLNTGTSLMSKSEEMKGLIDQISNLIVNSRASWEGHASDQYQAQWENAKPSFLSACDAVQTLGEQIKAYYEQLTALDQSAANSFK